MIDLEFLERLIEAIDRSGIDSVEIERGGTRIRISKSPPVPDRTFGNPGASSPPALAVLEGLPVASHGSDESVAAEAPTTRLIDVTSPMVGTFYRSPSPEAPPYVSVGQRVAKGDPLCIIEAMKLMNELESEVDGIVTDVLAANAEPVEYGQALFRIDPA